MSFTLLDSRIFFILHNISMVLITFQLVCHGVHYNYDTTLNITLEDKFVKRINELPFL